MMAGPVPYWDPVITVPSFNSEHRLNDLNVYYLLSDFILAFMLTRMYFLLRSITNYSQYTDSFARKLCRNYGVSTGLRFSMRCYLKNNPGITIGVMFLSSVLILAYILRIFEGPCSYALGA